ncbi:MAG: response regulator transcription factor [Actinomycetia bacterium]|nr:response regulator transcription factor [Actinomycetes bacterium]
MIRVLVVDDQQLVRRGFRLVLQTVEGVTVVGEAAHGEEALAVIAKAAGSDEAVDVVLSDARMPVLDGVGLVRACRAEHPGLPVVVLTTFDDDQLVRDAVQAGAAGFVLKDCSPEELRRAIVSAHEGGAVIDPRVARALAVPAADPLEGLTPTERVVADHVAAGLSNTEIAAELVLAEGTVKNHVSALLRKLGQRDRTALALTLSRTVRTQPRREE